VPDPIIGAIDRFFDVVDGGVGAVDRVLNRTKHTEEQARNHRAKRAPDAKRSPEERASRAPEVIDVEVTSRPAPVPTKDRKLTVAGQRFRIVEVIAPDTGNTIFVVTNGSERAECATRALAEKILRGLEAP
jgi:hypothetical protein